MSHFFIFIAFFTNNFNPQMLKKEAKLAFSKKPKWHSCGKPTTTAEWGWVR